MVVLEASLATEAITRKINTTVRCLGTRSTSISNT
jgi:hypothetical protein